MEKELLGFILANTKAKDDSKQIKQLKDIEEFLNQAESDRKELIIKSFYLFSKFKIKNYIFKSIIGATTCQNLVLALILLPDEINVEDIKRNKYKELFDTVLSLDDESCIGLIAAIDYLDSLNRDSTNRISQIIRFIKKNDSLQPYSSMYVSSNLTPLDKIKQQIRNKFGNQEMLETLPNDINVKCLSLPELHKYQFIVNIANKKGNR
ncbi:MAG: hypothetical protein PHD02_00325 [Bacilli bacterium]|nr:hypothetical protein [Bacilli bacterium]